MQIVLVDHSVPHQRIEVDDLFPELRAIKHDENFLSQLLRLGEGEHFHHFVHRAEAAWKHHQRLRQIGEPELAHEEVMEIKTQLGTDVRVGKLLERKADVQSDSFASRFGGAAVSGFHNARTAA